MRRLWQNLKLKKFRYLCTRGLNQDPLENLFGMIRSYGIRNVNPNCSQFREFFKTSILNNFTASHSPGSNCEEDRTEGSLQNLKNFITVKTKSPVNSAVDCVYEQMEPTEFAFREINLRTLNLHAYISGYIAKKLLHFVRKCKNCEVDLIATEEQCKQNVELYELIRKKEYTADILLLPNSNFIKIFSNSTDVLNFFLPRMCLEFGLLKSLKNKLSQYILPEHFSCPEHSQAIFSEFSALMTKLYVFRWIKDVNLILNGKSSYSGIDPIKVQAQKYCDKFKSKNIAIAKTKKLGAASNVSNFQTPPFLSCLQVFIFYLVIFDLQ